MIIDMNIPMSPNVKADFAAFGCLSFQTKYKIIPSIGIQHKLKILTKTFGLSSTVIV